MNPKRPGNFALILMLGSLTALSPFSIDMYLPAFQKIAGFCPQRVLPAVGLILWKKAVHEPQGL